MTDLHSLIPDPLSSLQEAERFYCLDVEALEDVEVIDELNYLRPKLWGLPPVHWARERVFLLEEEIKKRQGDTNYGTRQHQMPKQAEGVEL